MDEVEEIKHRIDIVDLISSYLTLKKAGANYQALCPFHNEKTPSLMISPEKQIFKCFGCNEGGDIFSFVMKMENLEFREALEMLATRAGVKLRKFETRNPKSETNSKDRIDKKTRLFRVNSICAQVYHKILLTHPSGKVALEYLKNRGITEQTIKNFLIGYAPSSRAVKSFLLKKGFTESEMQNAGSPERFFCRIIFPITDVMGNVLGFTGRVIDKDQQPKYLNTPETIIFFKHRILYNLNRARGEIKLEKASIVVEGQMDVISSCQAGVKNVVATSGTALTPDHLQVLYRYTPNIIFSFDADSAGLATSKKAYEMALAEGFNVKMTNLGKYKDPGEMIEKEPELWLKTIKNAKEVIDWYFDLAFEKKSEIRNQKPETEKNQELSSQEKKEIAKEILPIIKKIPDTIEQADYIGKLARRLKVPEKIIYEAMEKINSKSEIRNQKSRMAPQQMQNSKDKDKTEKTKLTIDQIFLGLIIKNPQLVKKAKEKIKSADLAGESQKLYESIEKWYNENKDSDLTKFLARNLEVEEFKELEILLLEIEEKYSHNIDETLDDLTRKILSDKKEIIKEKYAQAIKEAEGKGDRARLKELIKEFQEAIK